MVELRKSPRINVNWRAGIKLPDGRFLFCKVLNISVEGVLLQSPENLQALRSYPMMIEVPGIDEIQHLYKVSCKGMIRHVVLSGDAYRVGVSLSEMSALHQELLDAWFSKSKTAIG